MKDILVFIGQNKEYFFLTVIVLSFSALLAFVVYEIIKLSRKKKKRALALIRLRRFKESRKKKQKTENPETKKPLLLYFKMLYLRKTYKTKK